MNADEVRAYMEEGARLREGLNYGEVYELGLRLSETFKRGNKLIICGNGGSAADAQHFAAEFVCKFRKDRKPLPALALNANSSSVTAIGNDYGYDKVFERQVEAFASKGDMVIGISTSGNSPNVINALMKANQLGCSTVAFTGRTGGKLKGIAGTLIAVDSAQTSLIQEVHIAVVHLLSGIVEDEL